jgi:hypothetical protein
MDVVDAGSYPRAAAANAALLAEFEDAAAVDVERDAHLLEGARQDLREFVEMQRCKPRRQGG